MNRNMLTCLALTIALGPTLAADTDTAGKKTSSTKKSEAKSDSAKKGEPKKDETPAEFKSESYGGLSFRGIGPALTSGRVVDIAVHPSAPSVWYVAVASSGLFKTTNAGTTWSSVFEGQGSSSVGCVTIDPTNPLIVWVGSGENNSQRSVGYGDGVYLSRDGGNSFENVGLKQSEHIGKIVVDPRDSNTVYVAAQGPLWRSGGDRGLYKTTDGGKNWKRVLTIDDDTGVSDLAIDPRHPDTIYAVAYQRRRHVWTLIDGGPSSGIHKSTDGGATWSKLAGGLPGGDVGRIGIAISPVDPNVVYAIVEAAKGAGGLFRTIDAGVNWEKRSSYVAGGPQYYQELIPDLKLVDRLYSMDFMVQVSEDGGSSFHALGESNKHVDNHALWIDPRDTSHLLVGCDGGLYETFDRGKSWDFKANLPVTQFYRVSIDNSQPFYYVYGGTQDNFTLGGPSRTTNLNGIRNSDWFVVVGGDGFQSAVDPNDPNIVYGEAQYGALQRFDRRSGEIVDIQPQPAPGDAPLRWNWDSPLLISPHKSTRLYFAAQRLYRSDDRGNSWNPISADLTRQIDRNKLPVMGRVWGIDAVAKNSSTSLYGNIVSLDESPRAEGLLYVGTDDGLIQVSEDGGQHWTRYESFPGIPDKTYVSDLFASQHDDHTLYAAFDNHKQGDFKPYLLKSSDRGKSWSSIASNLPERGQVWTVSESPDSPHLLFVGTEFGLYFSHDDGGHWIQLKSGLPTTPIHDIKIDPKSHDLVLATFGRGFYILDDSRPLIDAAATIKSDAALLPPATALEYIPSAPLGGNGRSFQGDSLYLAENPPYGASFTYWLKESVKTRKDRREEAEKKLVDDKKDLPYPDWNDLRAEKREEAPSIVLTVRDSAGQVVRRVSGPASSGFHRLSWDLRYPSKLPVAAQQPDSSGNLPAGPLVVPGSYSVAMERVVDGVATPLGSRQSFQVESLNLATLGDKDRAARLQFESELAELMRQVTGASSALGEALAKLGEIKRALALTAGSTDEMQKEARRIELALLDLQLALDGDALLAGNNEPTLPSISDRVGRAVYNLMSHTSPPTTTDRQGLEFARSLFAPASQALVRLTGEAIPKLEAQLEQLGAPYTVGRKPRMESNK